MLRTKFFVATFMFLAAIKAHATLIDFNTNPTNTLTSYASIVEDGFLLRARSGYLSFFNGDNIPDSGSPALLVNAGSPAAFSLERFDGGVFNLNSFLAAEGRNINSGFFPQFGATSVLVVGNLFGGGTLTSLFNMDSIADNSLNDFQRFTLVGFNNLISATFTAVGGESAYSFNVDEINVSTANEVPEPTSTALLGLALAGLYAARRRMQR